MSYKIDIVHNGITHTFKGSSESNAIMKAKIFLRKNNINYTNEQLKQRMGRPSQEVSKSLSLADIVIGANAILRYTSGKAASNAEIQRRADICSTCPRVSQATGCMSCGFSRRLANFVNAIRVKKQTETEIPAGLKGAYCGVCKCSIPMMLVTNYADFYTESQAKNEMRPDHCWLKQSSLNFTNE